MIRIECDSDPAPIAENISAVDAGGVIRNLADGPDVTVTISRSRPADGKIMLAVSDRRYFLGLFAPPGEAYQYVAKGNEGLAGRTLFNIEGEPTEIESQYVADASAAAVAVQEWGEGGREAATSGRWMRMQG